MCGWVIWSSTHSTCNFKVTMSISWVYLTLIGLNKIRPHPANTALSTANRLPSNNLLWWACNCWVSLWSPYCYLEESELYRHSPNSLAFWSSVELWHPFPHYLLQRSIKMTGLLSAHCSTDEQLINGSLCSHPLWASIFWMKCNIVWHIQEKPN